MFQKVNISNFFANLRPFCLKSWHKREKRLEKTHFFHKLFRAPEDSPQVNRGTSERKDQKKRIFFISFSERPKIHRFPISPCTNEISEKAIHTLPRLPMMHNIEGGEDFLLHKYPRF